MSEKLLRAQQEGESNNEREVHDKLRTEAESIADELVTISRRLKRAAELYKERMGTHEERQKH